MSVQCKGAVSPLVHPSEKAGIPRNLLHSKVGMRKVLLLVGVAWLLGSLSSVYAAAKTEARLLLAKQSASPGDTVMAAVQLRMQPRWHTYWRNAGDVGDRTKIE